MSANNQILIKNNTFEVYDYDVDCGLDKKHDLIGKGKSLKEAIEIAQKYQQENIVEYGIQFI